MCLSRIPEQIKKITLKALPGIFPCWKVIQTNGYCEYDYKKQEPKFTRRTHIAVMRKSDSRANLRGMQQGFHAYLASPKKLVMFRHSSRAFKVVKCYANKKDIITIGHCSSSGYNIMAISVSKITRK